MRWRGAELTRRVVGRPQLQRDGDGDDGEPGEDAPESSGPQDAALPTEEDGSQRTRRRFAFYLGAVLVALFFLRVLGEPWDTHFPPKFPDALNPPRTDTYYAIASLTPFRPEFYWAPRPIAYPALIWALGRNSHLVVLAQMTGYCAAFGFLCVTALRLIRNRPIAIAATLLLVLVAAQGRFALWNTQVLSESLGISLGIMVIASWWRVAAAPSLRRVTWAWVWTTLWVLARDNYAVPVVAGVLPAAVGFGWLARTLAADVRRRLLVGAGVTVLVIGYVYAAQQASGRNKYPLYSNIGVRVLPDPALRAWFVDGGMPLDDALRARQGKFAFDDDRRFETDPALARFREWAEGPGARRMALSFVLRAPDWYGFLADEWERMLEYDYGDYDSYSVLDRLPARIPLHLAGPGTPRGLVVWLALAAIASALALRRFPRSGPVWFGLAGIVLVLLELYVSVAADPLEVLRHVVGALARLSVMLIVCTAVALDALGRDPRQATADRGVDPAAG